MSPSVGVGCKEWVPKPQLPFEDRRANGPCLQMGGGTRVWKEFAKVNSTPSDLSGAVFPPGVVG
jgi:hypothetical protein